MWLKCDWDDSNIDQELERYNCIWLCFGFFIYLFFFWYAILKSASNTVVLFVFSVVLRLTADLKRIKWCIMINFTLNVNAAFTFEVMCLEVPYLDTQYFLHCLLKGKCCLYCSAFTCQKWSSRWFGYPSIIQCSKGNNL